MVIAVAWGLSVPIGMIYWAVQENMLNVVLSVIIPAYGIVSTVSSLLLG